MAAEPSRRSSEELAEFKGMLRILTAEQITQATAETSHKMPPGAKAAVLAELERRGRAGNFEPEVPTEDYLATLTWKGLQRCLKLSTTYEQGQAIGREMGRRVNSGKHGPRR